MACNIAFVMEKSPGMLMRVTFSRRSEDRGFFSAQCGCHGRGCFIAQLDLGNSISPVLHTVNKATEEYKGSVGVVHDVSLSWRSIL